MGDLGMTKRPKAGVGDAAHTLAKASLSMFPVFGGSAAELFSAILQAPMFKRRDEWIESIAKGLEELKGKIEGFKLESLSENESFVTTVLQATQAAIRNHQKEKLEALRNAVLNAALPNAPEEDIQQMFLNFVDTLTPGHLRILKFFENPKQWGRNHGVAFPEWNMGGPATVLEHTFPELTGRRHLYDLFVKDLFARGLMSIDSLHTTMTSQGMFESRTTDLGNQFIRFIQSPIEPNDKGQQC